MSATICSRCGKSNRLGASFCNCCGAPFVARLQIGQVLHGQYTIIRLLGRGGMGAVYLASQTIAKAQRHMVIKEMLDYFDPADPQEEAKARQRFEAEASTLVNLNQAGIRIPQIFDFFTEGGRNYIVMDYIEGKNLEEGLTHEDEDGKEIKGQPYDTKEVKRWGIQVCKVLEHLAQKNVVHLDIKPANLILDRNGDIWLVDFGTAKAQRAMQTTGRVGMKQTSIFGTEGYAPPEQYAGRVEPRTDVYSLAATLYHLLTDDHPRRHSFVFPKLDKLPKHLANALRQATEQDVSQRPTAVEFGQLLDQKGDGQGGRWKIWPILLVGLVLTVIGVWFAANQMATVRAERTATAVAQQTETAIAQATATAYAQYTGTVAAETAITIAQATTTVYAQQTSIANAQAQATATMSVNQTGTAMAQLEGTVLFVAQQTGTAIAQATATASARQTSVAIASTATAGAQQTGTAVVGTAAAIARVTETAIAGATATASAREISTAVARTVTAAAQQTETAIANAAATASARQISTAVAQTATAGAQQTETAIAAATATASARQIRAAVAQTATAGAQQTAIARRTATAIAQATATVHAKRNYEDAIEAAVRRYSNEIKIENTTYLDSSRLSEVLIDPVLENQKRSACWLKNEGLHYEYSNRSFSVNDITFEYGSRATILARIKENRKLVRQNGEIHRDYGDDDYRAIYQLQLMSNGKWYIYCFQALADDDPAACEVKIEGENPCE